MNYTDNKIINALPEEFGRQDLLREVLSRGYSVSKANQILECECLTGKLERIGRGRYRKTSSKKLAAKELHGLGYSYREIAEKLRISKSLVGNYLNEGGQ